MTNEMHRLSFFKRELDKWWAGEEVEPTMLKAIETMNKLYRMSDATSTSLIKDIKLKYKSMYEKMHEIEQLRKEIGLLVS